jgi:hypothetical protein
MWLLHGWSGSAALDAAMTALLLVASGSAASALSIERTDLSEVRRVRACGRARRSLLEHVGPASVRLRVRRQRARDRICGPTNSPTPAPSDASYVAIASWCRDEPHTGRGTPGCRTRGVRARRGQQPSGAGAPCMKTEKPLSQSSNNTACMRSRALSKQVAHGQGPQG